MKFSKSIILFSAFITITLLSCSKSGNENPMPTIPNTGLFVSTQFAEDQIIFHSDLIYSKRNNFKINGENYQYTSSLTQTTELQVDILSLKLDLALPPNATASKKVPLLVFIHGGNFLSGDKSAHTKEVKSYV